MVGWMEASGDDIEQMGDSYQSNMPDNNLGNVSCERELASKAYAPN